WSAKINTPAKKIFYKKFTGEMPIAGEFNRYNAAAALACTNQTTLKGFPGVPGRMEKIPNDRDIDLYIDFAHTPDALECVLSSLKKECRKELTVVFGCGGNRDQQKRPLMGDVAKKFADHIIVTSDNPRTEDPEKICRDIGCEKVIIDRKEAIERAIAQASPGDTVIIAGRGHEPFQIIGTQKNPFSDAIIANKACTKSEKLLK
ncbi:MAG: cyanophycin synthetase, partial [Simkaniaceae bacterium]|nr:cyanophycin synthetase [Simkaniaceae bacterium]